jgi:coproporphyrinogen III oxidase-like Fe-S oxidoreductase
MTETASNIATSILALAERNVPRYRLPQGYVQNAPDIGSYLRAIDARQFAVKKGSALSSDDRTRARIIERLMCDLAVDLDRCGALRNRPIERCRNRRPPRPANLRD